MRRPLLFALALSRLGGALAVVYELAENNFERPAATSPRRGHLRTKTEITSSCAEKRSDDSAQGGCWSRPSLLEVSRFRLYQ